MKKLIYSLLGFLSLFMSCSDQEESTAVITKDIPIIKKDSVISIIKDSIDFDKFKSKKSKKIVKKVLSEGNKLNITASLGTATGGVAYQVKDIANLLPAIIEVLDKNLKDKTDVVFLIDKTGSMSDDIDQVKKHTGLLIHCLSKFDKIKTAVVLYGDKNEDGELWMTFDSLKADSKYSLIKLRNVSTTGGGDWEESANDALGEVVNKMNWTPGASKMILLIGDAPSLEPPKSKFATQDIIQLCRKSGVTANIYPILFSLENIAGTKQPTSLTDVLYSKAKLPNPDMIKNAISNIYPNPAEVECTIELNKESGGFNAMLFDMSGAIIKNEYFVGKTGRLDLKKVPAGNYIVRISGEGNSWNDSKKIIVVK